MANGIGRLDISAGAERRTISRTTVRIAIAIGAVALVVGALVVAGGMTASVALVLLAVLSAIGFAALIGIASGLLRVSIDHSRNEIAEALLDQPNASIAVTNEGDEVVFANESYVALSPANGLPLSPTRLWAEQHGTRSTLKALADTARAGDRAVGEVRVGDQLTRWFRVIVNPLRGSRRGQLVWNFSDVTDERVAEETEYRTARDAISHLDHLPIGVAVARNDGVIAHVNATLADQIGMDLTEFRQRELRLEDIISNDTIAQLRSSGSGRNAVLGEVLRFDGRGFAAHVLSRKGETSPPRELFSVIEADRLPLPEASEFGSSDGMAERYYAASPAALAVVQADGRITRPNAAFNRIFGLDVGSDHVALLPLVPEANREQVRRALQDASVGRASIDPVDIVIPSEGASADRHLQLWFTAVRSDQSDSPTNYAALTYATESTEQKAIEAAYIQGQKMQAIGLLAGGLAHDFNNVLAAITVSADLLLETHGVGDPSHKDIRNVKTSANRAAALVRQLLAYSRQQTLRPSVLNLADVLSDGRILYQRLANPAKLELELGSDLWPVRADLGQFEQVVTNLVANARDAMANGGTIVISARNLPSSEAAGMTYRGFEPADYVMVEVVDSGTGMPPEVQAQIFDPFFTTKDVGKGTGLGMSMVYGIVKQSGGYIYADSEVGVGTRFRIMLPRHIAQEGSGDAASAGEPRKALRDITGSGIVLIVEDDNSVRPGAVRALTSRGYTVHEAADGEEALEVLEELNGEVDIIVSDVVMPGMDGPTFLREMRAIYGDDIPFVFASGHAEEAFAKNLPEGSVFSFLPKPYSLSSLATKVKDVLAGKE